MTLAVVILNWNGMDLLKKFLPDVVQFSPEARVYIADNASTDRSVKYVKEHYPNVQIIQNAVNGGYAKGYNDALSGLEEDIFILLNSDVQVTPHWLDPMVTIFKNQPGVAAVQPKILDFKNPEYFEYAGAGGGYIDRFGYPFCRGRILEHLEKDMGQYDDESEIFWASGACLAIRREVFYKVGALDEDYFAHQEEIDLCWRLFNFGYKVKYTPFSQVYHVGGATLNSMNPQKTFYNFRNSLFNLVKNVPGSSILVIVLCRMMLDGVAAFKFLFSQGTSHFTAVLRAHFSFYKHLPGLLNKRKKLPKKVGYFYKNSVLCDRYFLGKKTFSEL